MFKEYLGNLELTVDEKDLELDIGRDEMKSIITVQDPRNQKPRKRVDDLMDVYMDVLKKSYPEANPKALESFLVKNFMELTRKLTAELSGIQDEEIKDLM